MFWVASWVEIRYANAMPKLLRRWRVTVLQIDYRESRRGYSYMKLCWEVYDADRRKAVSSVKPL